MRMRRLSTIALLAVGTYAALPGTVTAQAYPNKPIRIIVPFPPGAFNDTLGRTIAQKFSDGGLGQAVVDNRPGAGSTLGADLAAKSTPDGHTLLIVAVPFAVNATLYTKLPYNTERDFIPIIFAGSTPNLLVIHPSMPIRTVRELIALAKAKPGQLNYASTGSGSSNHMSMELFKMMTQTDILHIPYKGSAPALTDLMGGHVMMIFDNMPNVLPHVKGGKLRGIAVTSLQRSALAQEIPTVDESGVPGYEVSVWFGVVGPAGIAREIVMRLNTEINKILQMNDVRERFQAGGVDPAGGSAEKFGEHLKTEIAKWGKVVKATGARVD
jgi:tripartite-type tricarboxylate transporter receptor subunit TctC